jgi:hypothetical protein
VDNLPLMPDRNPLIHEELLRAQSSDLDRLRAEARHRDDLPPRPWLGARIWRFFRRFVGRVDTIGPAA